jgi:hypothetical protein
MEGRGISHGVGEGKALVLEEPFSFLGGADPGSGRLTIEGRDDPVAGKVLVFPRGKGSTVGSYVILDLVRAGNGPVALVNARAEPIVATGAVMAGLPMVDSVDLSLIKEVDDIRIDASKGTVEIMGMREVPVVTSILRNKGKILVLLRSDEVGSCQGMWAGVSGFIESGESPMEAATREIKEEVGMDTPSLIRIGEAIRARRDDRIWLVHPFLFEVGSREITTDWEHVDHRWIDPSELLRMGAVPKLDQVFRSLGLL